MLQQHLPHGRHGGGERHALGLDQFVHRGAVELLARHHHLAAHRRAGERQPPGVGVEHRHHRQHHVAGRQPHHVMLQRDQRVQEVGAVRVEHALRVAGRAGGVAETGRRLLVEPAPFAVFAVLLDQGLETERAVQADAGHVALVGHHDHRLDALHVGAPFDDGRQEGKVGEEDLILGVADDVAELVGEQPRVQRVAHRADPHDRVPGLHVAAGVPGQRRDPVAGLHAQPLERVGESLGPRADVGVGGADDRSFDRTGDDLTPAVPVGGVVEQFVQRQRPVLHQAQHQLSSKVISVLV